MINVVLEMNLFREKAKMLKKETVSTLLFSSALSDLLLGKAEHKEEK